ncbi:MAG: hypothetical protein QF371_05380 [Flavobacteriales bacterium]|nr:hypothetical protein [Flavobacteriales bacterium]
MSRKLKVIMIGGTSYSGSTLLELMLANDPVGFSCGEVWSLFMPHKLQQFSPRFPMEDKDPHFWKRILRKGYSRVYESVAEEIPHIRFITDNTKRPVWQWDQANRLREHGHEVHHVLIWKTPSELATSFHKRGRGSIWMKKWLNYHRQYFSMIDTFTSVRYSDLVNNPMTLQNLCESIGIPFFPEKKQYWIKDHYTLFGNKSAKVHLFDQKSEHYHRVSEKLELGTGDSVGNAHRQVAYKQSDSTGFKEEIETVQSHPSYGSIVQMLKVHDVNSNQTEDFTFPAMPPFEKRLKIMQFHIFRFVTRINLLFYQLTGLKLGRKVATSE